MTTMSLSGLILSSALFSVKVFWPYFSSVVFLFIGLAFIPGNKWVRSRGIEKALALAPLFIAVPLGAFGTDHFVEHTSIARIVPAWMPAHLFWVYFVGVALIAAALSIAANQYVRLSATLLGLMFFLFVLLMHIPTLAAHPKNRFALAYVLRDSFFSAGAIALSRAHREDFEAAHIGWSLSRAWSLEQLRPSMAWNISCIRILCRSFPLSSPSHHGFRCNW